MKLETYAIRNGYNKKTCIVHARCCHTPYGMFATAQNLDVSGSDLFSGIMMSQSHDDGKTWSEFIPQEGLKPITLPDGKTLVGCDGTPMYHKKTGTVLLLGHTASYLPDSLSPVSGNRSTFYSILKENTQTFSEIKFIQMPAGFENCGNGCGQSVELENGDLLIPVYYKLKNSEPFISAVIRCSYDGERVKLLELGDSLEMPDDPRGLYEPSITCHNGVYYLTLRGDDFGYVAKSSDGLHFTDLQKWRWDDGEILPTYNTQQHWLTCGGQLYLVYTRRGAGNDHVFRHRAPLFIAEVENMCIKRSSEMIAVTERGARLGNFCAGQVSENKAFIMAAEWMQPAGCEGYGSDNSIFIAWVER